MTQEHPTTPNAPQDPPDIWPAGPLPGIPAGELLLPQSARALAVQLFAEVHASWQGAAELVARAQRSERQLAGKVRRAVGELVFRAIRLDRRLDAIVDETLAGHRGPKRGLSDVARLEVKILLVEMAAGAPEEVMTAELKKRFGFEPQLRSLLRPDAGLRKLKTRDALERTAVELSFPTWMYKRLSTDLGVAAAHGLAGSFNERAPLTVLCTGRNASTSEKGKVSAAEVGAAEIVAAVAKSLEAEGVPSTPCRFAKRGLALGKRVNVFGLETYKKGLIDVMDEGSQLIAEVVDAQPGHRVVDACAGAGGKTLALGGPMGGKGRLLSMDINAKKLEELRRRARQAGLTNLQAVPLSGAALPSKARTGAWDRVLVDAPCSGVGSMRRAPETRWRLRETDIRSYANDQVGLLGSYAPLVAPGGRLIYATCTLFAEENDDVIDRFCAEHSNYERVAVSDIFGAERAQAVGDGLCLRLFPHVHKCDGFFAAVLQRTS